MKKRIKWILFCIALFAICLSVSTVSGIRMVKELWDTKIGYAEFLLIAKPVFLGVTSDCSFSFEVDGQRADYQAENKEKGKQFKFEAVAGNMVNFGISNGKNVSIHGQSLTDIIIVDLRGTAQTRSITASLLILFFGIIFLYGDVIVGKLSRIGR